MCKRMTTFLQLLKDGAKLTSFSDFWSLRVVCLNCSVISVIILLCATDCQHMTTRITHKSTKPHEQIRQENERTNYSKNGTMRSFSNLFSQGVTLLRCLLLHSGIETHLLTHL